MDGHIAMPVTTTFPRLYLVSGTKNMMAMKFTDVSITAIHSCHRQLKLVTMNPQIKGPKVLPPAIPFLGCGQCRGLARNEKYLHVESHFPTPFMQEVQVLNDISISTFPHLLSGIIFHVLTTGVLARSG
jgi:hypothetical protein